jgi:hypothetical protein
MVTSLLAASALATPTGVTVSINQGDSRTTSDVVFLYMTASTTSPPMQMRFSNWGFGTSSNWEPYFQKKLWMLEPAGTLNATKGVTVEFKDATGTASASDGIFVAAPLNLRAVAENRWYPSNLTQNHVTLSGPAGVCFDGLNLWVALWGGGVSKIRAADRAVLGTYGTDTNPECVVYDGMYVWILNNGSGTVTQRQCDDGTFVRTVTVGPGPRHGCFDGRYVWVNSSDGRLYQINAVNGTVTSTDVLGNGPEGIAFDGNNLWVALWSDNVVKKVRPSDFAVLGTYPVGSGPWGVLFDGANIWVANSTDNTVTKLRAVDGANRGSFPVGSNPIALAFDGSVIWVVNQSGNTVSKLRAADGSAWGTVSVPSYPLDLAFDGASVWVVSYSGGALTKM